MSLFTHGHLWQQEELSDVDIVIRTESDAAMIRVLPGHSAILSSCSYFHAQMVRWKQDDGVEGERAAKQTGSRKRLRLWKVTLTLQDPAEEAAAMAVLAALYAVKPVAELLGELSQEQQLQAALLADMWQVPTVSATAVQLLMDAAGSDGSGLSAAVIDRFFALLLRACPACLLPLLKPVAAATQPNVQDADQQAMLKGLLLSMLDDLEEVWADEQLKKALLELPLAAMELLLSCDELKVASEDTMLYTAQAYIDKITDQQQQQHTRRQLAPLIRCPQLSLYWLSAAVHSPDAPKLLLNPSVDFKKLLLMRLVHPAIKAGRLAQELPGAPASWSLQPRAHTQLSGGVQLQWAVDVDAIKAAAQSSAKLQDNVDLRSSCVSAPLGGISFDIAVECEWGDAAQGSMVGLYAVPLNIPGDTFVSFSFGLQCQPGRLEQKTRTSTLSGLCGQGWRNFFGVGFMSGGWDEAAWAAKGLPISGALEITLIIPSVNGQPV